MKKKRLKPLEVRVLKLKDCDQTFCRFARFEQRELAARLAVEHRFSEAGQGGEATDREMEALRPYISFEMAFCAQTGNGFGEYAWTLEYPVTEQEAAKRNMRGIFGVAIYDYWTAERELPMDLTGGPAW